MSQAEALWRLQIIDLEIDEKRSQLKEAQSNLGETEELRAARRRVAEMEAALHELRKTLRRQELEAQGLEEKLRTEEERLYGGRVRNPKELADLNEEVNYLRRALAAMEDDVLETMVSIEDREAKLSAAREELRRVEVAWGDEQARLRAEVERLGAQLEELKEERQDALLYVTEESRRLYDTLRRAKGGRAVALLEGTLCQGCLISLPTSEAQRVRRGDSLVHCSHCGRILYSRS